jgi:sulfonate transport system substrate-binding protein
MNTDRPTRGRGRLATTVLIPALSAALALALAGCGGAATGNEDAVSDDGSVDLSKVTLIVGDQKGGSQALLQAAGELDDVPYRIEWKEFTSGPPLLEALNSGAIHVGGVGNTPPIFAAAADGRFKAVQAATYGGGGDAIVVPPGSPVKSVADLEGRTVAVAQGSSANYNLLAQLEKAGLKYSDVKVENLQPADALAAFSSGHVDAWAIWEPFTSQAEQEAGAKVIATGDGVVNGDVFQVASDEALDDPGTKKALDDYLARIARAQVWSQTHQEEWSTTWAEETGLAPAITLAAVGKRKIQVLPIDDDVVASEQAMADTFTDNGLLPGHVDLSDFFSDQYNQAVQAATGA